MRTIDKINAPQDFFKYFQELIAKQKTALVWQVDENKQNRSLYRVVLASSRREEDTLKAECLEKGRDFLLPEADVFFYVQSLQLLFKSEKLSIEGHSLLGKLPKELKVLNEDEHDRIIQALAEIDPTKKEMILDYSFKRKPAPSYEVGESVPKEGYEFEIGESVAKESPYQEAPAKPSGSAEKEVREQSARDREIFETELSFVSLDEEDKLYADKRNAPRARPPEGKMITMQLSDGSNTPGVFSLFDLSRGGLAVLTFSAKDYKAGDVVNIMAFDTKTLDEPMLAEVKSVREADEQGLQYKIGMQFI